MARLATVVDLPSPAPADVTRITRGEGPSLRSGSGEPINARALRSIRCASRNAVMRWLLTRPAGP